MVLLCRSNECVFRMDVPRPCADRLLGGLPFFDNPFFVTDATYFRSEYEIDLKDPRHALQFIAKRSYALYILLHALRPRRFDLGVSVTE